VSVFSPFAPAFGADARCEILLTQIARFEKPLTEIYKAFNPRLTVDQLIDRMMAEDTRGKVFKVEALLRMYRHVHGEPLETMKDDVKALEDALGAYGERVEFLEFGQKIHAPKRVIAELRERAEEARETLRQFLKDEGWVKRGRASRANLTEIRAQLNDEVDWHGAKKDRRKVIKELISEIEQVEAFDWDPADLEEGTHKERIRLRWLLLDIQSLDGLIVLEDPKDGVFARPEYAYLLTHPIAESKFSKIEPNPRERNPVLLSRHLFLAISKIVQELGADKAYGENAEAVAEAYRDAGLVESKREGLKRADALSQKAGVWIDWEAAARKTKKELERTKLLKAVRKALEDQLED
jgi:hypothetical protein